MEIKDEYESQTERYEMINRWSQFSESLLNVEDGRVAEFPEVRLNDGNVRL